MKPEPPSCLYSISSSSIRDRCSPPARRCAPRLPASADIPDRCSRPRGRRRRRSDPGRCNPGVQVIVARFSAMTRVHSGFCRPRQCARASSRWQVVGELVLRHLLMVALRADHAGEQAALAESARRGRRPIAPAPRPSRASGSEQLRSPGTAGSRCRSADRSKSAAASGSSVFSWCGPTATMTRENCFLSACRSRTVVLQRTSPPCARMKSAAGSGNRRERSTRGSSRSLAPASPASESRSTARKTLAEACSGGVLSAETQSGAHR